jgi:hypothetical protein
MATKAVGFKRANGTNGVALPIRIEFLMTRTELADALAYDMKGSQDGEPLPTLSRSRVLDIVRQTLRYAGESGQGCWSDYVSEVRYREIERWALATVERTLGDVFRAAGE